MLGAYLGDGTVYHQAPGFRGLRIVNDRQYQRISEEIRAAMSATFPGGSVRTWPSSIGESDILHVSHPAIPSAFPQHGPSRKHARTIELADWQLALTRAHPGALVRGLIHSDGCRSRNSFTTKLPSGRESVANPRRGGWRQALVVPAPRTGDEHRTRGGVADEEECGRRDSNPQGR